MELFWKLSVVTIQNSESVLTLSVLQPEPLFLYRFLEVSLVAAVWLSWQIKWVKQHWLNQLLHW
jgi:hypothetical protein